MEAKSTGYSVNIQFSPGNGFYVITNVDGHYYVTPDSFVSLEHAARFVADHLQKAGYIVTIADPA